MNVKEIQILPGYSPNAKLEYHYFILNRRMKNTEIENGDTLIYIEYDAKIVPKRIRLEKSGCVVGKCIPRYKNVLIICLDPQLVWNLNFEFDSPVESPKVKIQILKRI